MMFLNYINYFRGFAIFMIVLGHGLNLLPPNTFYNKFFISTIANGTGLFVFISGFLFYHIFYRRGFNLKKFILNKIKNVVLPYSIICLPALIIILYEHKQYQELYEYNKVLYIFLYYISGKSLGVTWYIPFAMLLFLSSPIFINYINLNTKSQKIIIVLGIGLGMVVGRPILDLKLNIFQAFIYFFPYYCMGIYIAINQEVIVQKIEKKVVFLGIICLLFISFQVLVNNYITVSKKMFEITILDFMIIQKIIMCLFMIGIFKKLERSNLELIKKLFNILGNYSFGIFFIHNYLYQILYKLLEGLNLESLNIVTSFLLGVINIFISLIIVYIIKKILKKNSRVIIGC